LKLCLIQAGSGTHQGSLLSCSRRSTAPPNAHSTSRPPPAPKPRPRRTRLSAACGASTEAQAGRLKRIAIYTISRGKHHLAKATTHPKITNILLLSVRNGACKTVRGVNKNIYFASVRTRYDCFDRSGLFLGLFFGSIGRTDWWCFGKTSKTNRNRPQF